MNIIRKEPYENGSFPPIQSWNPACPIPEGFAAVPADFDTSVFYQHKTFVFLTVENMDGVDTVTAMQPNAEAWEKWRVENPVEERPEPEAKITAEVLADAIMRGLSL